MDFENEKLIGRKENIEVFWEIYNKNDGVSIELRIEGNLSYLPDDYLGWGVFFTSDNPSLTSLHSSDNTSVILSKLSGKENSFYSGSVPIIISTDDASGKTIGASYRGELSLAIVSD